MGYISKINNIPFSKVAKFKNSSIQNIEHLEINGNKPSLKQRHSFGEPTYTWTEDGSGCSAKRVCLRDSSDIETENGTVTSAVHSTANCVEEGVTRYTSTFTNSAFSFQVKDITDLPIDANNHKSSAISDGNYDATCTTTGWSGRTVCPDCGVVITEGSIINALGHSYGTPTYVWNEDNTSCVATRICSRDASHIETESGVISSVVKVASTCTSMGTTTYTATFNNAAFTTQTKDVVDIAMLGHSYGTPSYTWSSDGKICTAKRVCSNDSSHVETENGTITSAIKVASTCEGKGTTTYTAKFSNSAFSTQTKDIVDIDVLGHNIINHVCTRCGYTEYVPGLFDSNGNQLSDLTVAQVEQDSSGYYIPSSWIS